MLSIFIYVKIRQPEIDENYKVIHDPVVIKFNILVNEPASVHLFDSFNHLDENIYERDLVRDATCIHVLLN